MKKKSILFLWLWSLTMQGALRRNETIQKIEDSLIAEHTNQALYAPWREIYKPEINEQTPHRNQENCIFCLQSQSPNPRTHFILKKTEHCLVMLNLFPFSKGHLLIIPQKHVKNLDELSAQERIDLIETITTSTRILKSELEIEGYNIGMNIERCAGASFPDHMHVHIVPRESSDSSFIRVIGKTNVICWDLKELYAQLYPAFNA